MSAADALFHAGELAVQTRLGVRERVAQYAPRMVRDHMPEQHRAFYAQLPFLILGGVDPAGWPWASLCWGAPGFLETPDARHLRMTARPAAGDPLWELLRPGAAVGGLGIELATRRRNRLSMHVAAVDAAGVSFAVDQAYGNCPQYIHPRALSGASPAPQPVRRFRTLAAADAGLIAAADTCFVASVVPGDGAATPSSADVSHRGGAAGFVRVSGSTLTVPDYRGNRHYNTLGNFAVYPRAGLCFVDFARGDLLLLTGTVAMIWDGDARLGGLDGAERAWTFTLDHGLRLPGVLPLRWYDVAPGTSRGGEATS